MSASYMGCFLVSFLSIVIYLFLAVLGLCCYVDFSLVVESKGFSLQWLLLLWHPGSGAQAQQLWCKGLAAPWHVGSSWIRDWTRVSCTGRQVLYHWATREAPGGGSSGISALSPDQLILGVIGACLMRKRKVHSMERQLFINLCSLGLCTCFPSNASAGFEKQVNHQTNELAQRFIWVFP